MKRTLFANKYCSIEEWLRIATYWLNQNDRMRIRNEYREHYEEALNEELSKSLCWEEAHSKAIRSLGNPELIGYFLLFSFFSAAEQREIDILSSFSWKNAFALYYKRHILFFLMSLFNILMFFCVFQLSIQLFPLTIPIAFVLYGLFCIMPVLFTKKFFLARTFVWMILWIFYCHLTLAIRRMGYLWLPSSGICFLFTIFAIPMILASLRDFRMRNAFLKGTENANTPGDGTVYE